MRTILMGLLLFFPCFSCATAEASGDKEKRMNCIMECNADAFYRDKYCKKLPEESQRKVCLDDSNQLWKECIIRCGKL